MVTQRFGSRTNNLFIAGLIGLLLIGGAGWLLFFNEVKIDVSRMAQKSIEITADKPPTDNSSDGKLVSVSGMISSDQLLGDGLFIKAGRNILLQRKVEVFAWQEAKDGKTKTGEAAVTYRPGWTETPADSAKFQDSTRYHNPPLKWKSATFKTRDAKIGLLEIDPTMIGFPKTRPLLMNKDNLKLPPEVKMISKWYLFSGTGKINKPKIGDIRVSYFSLPEGARVTVLGKLSQGAVVPYLDADNNRLYRLFYGSRDSALAILGQPYNSKLWIMRSLGFILLWAGIAMLFESLLELGFISGITGWIKIVQTTFLASLLISAIIILVASLTKSLFALISLAALAAIGSWFFVVQKKKKL